MLLIFLCLSNKVGVCVCWTFKKWIKDSLSLRKITVSRGTERHTKNKMMKQKKKISWTCNGQWPYKTHKTFLIRLWVDLLFGEVTPSVLARLSWGHLIFFHVDSFQFSSVQSLSCVWLFETPWIAALQASLSSTNSWSLPKPMPIWLVMPSSHLILCRPLLLLPPPLPASGSFPVSQLFTWGGQKSFI